MVLALDVVERIVLGVGRAEDQDQALAQAARDGLLRRPAAAIKGIDQGGALAWAQINQSWSA